MQACQQCKDTSTSFNTHPNSNQKEQCLTLGSCLVIGSRLWNLQQPAPLTTAGATWSQTVAAAMFRSMMSWPLCRVYHCASCCRRGKRSQKHYTVFVADVDAKVARDFVPELDLDEHKVWKWVPWADVLAAATGSNAELELHPVVAALASQHANDVHSASQMCTAAAAAGGH